MSLKEMEDLKQHYLDEMKSLINDLQINDYRNEKIDIHFRRECEDMIMSIEINKKKELQYLEQESTIPLNEIDSQTPSSIKITPVLPTLEPEDSLIMGNEELSTTLEKESDEFINSSVEDLVPTPSEPEDKSERDSDCDLPSENKWKKILYYAPIDDLIFDPGDDIDEIDTFLDVDISTDIKDGYHDSREIYSILRVCLKTAGNHRKVQINELNELRDQAYENSLIYKDKIKKIHDSKIKNRVFNVGDRVLLFNS
ncbi:hypothetical protein Tco_1018203 [Tanacetum coccineum]|uniref:Uncharacterized protein n=1 Tax=Tanacetum coccineum TaxID=301880 RepID=A0ABQ5FV22_9ASTR